MLKSKLGAVIAGGVILIGIASGTALYIHNTNHKTPVKSQHASTVSTNTPSQDEPDFGHAKLFKIGDNVQFASESVKVNNVRTATTLSTQYSQPYIADQGTKFVVVNMTITNTTTNPFMYTPFVLFDQKNRQYDAYKNSVLALDSYFTGQTLSPSIPTTAEEAYQVPADSTSFRLGGFVGTSNQLQLVQFTTN